MPFYNVENTTGRGLRVKEVLLSGLPVSHVLEADTESGHLERIVVDEDSRPVLEGSDMKTETLFGTVDVVFESKSS